jgi:hypothetical protein
VKIYVFEHQDFFQYYDDDYLRVFWAENKHDAVKKLVHNVSSDEAYRESLFSDDVCLELPFLSDDEYERYFVENDLRYWSVKEYEVEEEKRVFLFKGEDLTGGYHLIFAKDLDDAKNKMYWIESKSESLIDYVYEKAVNFGIAEIFYDDEKGEMLDLRFDIESRLDLVYKYGDKAEEYIEKKFEENVRDFFGENVEFADMYLEYYRNDEDVDFPPEFFRYVVEKMTEDGNWMKFKVYELHI